jgi:uncharacterized protein
MMDAEGHMRTAARLVSKARKICRERRGSKAYQEALDLLNRAAKIGSAEAEYAIGTWHLFGRNVPKDDRKAAQHLEKAARKKYVPAMFDMAVLLETGRGVGKDKSRAFKLYVQAAQQRDLDAIKSVGRCLFYGIGVARNREVGYIVLDYAEAVSGPQRKSASRRASPKVRTKQL